MAYFKADQFELPGTEPAFNLASETIETREAKEEQSQPAAEEQSELF